LKAIAEDLKEEVKKRKAWPLWRGGTIPSNFKSFFPDVDPEGNFKRIFFKQGDGMEFFALE
jgi:hypothetical protein